MKTLTAKDGKYCFGRYTLPAPSRGIARQNSPVVVVMEFDEFARLKVLEGNKASGQMVQPTARS